MKLEDVDAVDRVRQNSWVDSYESKEYAVSPDLINDYFAYRRKKQNKAEKLNRIKAELDDINAYTKVATSEDGRVVGMIFGKKNSATEATLGALYLEPSYIGKGNGRLLMDGFIEWLGKGVECDLFVVNYNERAIKFYEKYGFEIASTEPAKELHLDDSHPLVAKMLVIKMIRQG
ncbi:GNAT family N-acetyltransferase [Candidatus Saccharibacteria bacterium]|jgi:GNAT superfamily N-acetyltransferase|nr:GNAT family N-acetyltransferase [Candidatus Saccharibacteria bacterium]